jgi:hypothetical protein
VPSLEKYMYGLICTAIGLSVGFYSGRKFPDQDAVKKEISDQLESKYLKGKSDGAREVKALVDKGCEEQKDKSNPEKDKFLQ